MKHRLYIVEGLPCSGKSTTARFVAEQLHAQFVDEGTGNHPADYEFHAYLEERQLRAFSPDEQKTLLAKAEQKQAGYVIPLSCVQGELMERLLPYKIYDFLTWETEKPLMLDKWAAFVQNADANTVYVFNCVLLQNPICETMMRFNFDEAVSQAYIHSICEILKPLHPAIIYLKNDHIAESVRRAAPERGREWLDGVIEYHCGGEYGKTHGLNGFDGYIAALEERQERELRILQTFAVDSLVLDNPQRDWEKAYRDIQTFID